MSLPETSAEHVIIDTDVFSFLLRPHDSRAYLYRPHLAGKRIGLSFVTVGELYAWAEKYQWAQRRREALEQAFASAVLLPYDLELCRTYGRVKAALPRGRVIPSNDLWIATAAIQHGLRLFTHNRRDFEGIPGLRIFSQA